MRKLAKKINENGCVTIALSENPDVDYFESIGFTEQEVEKGFDGQWYLKGYAPQKPLDELKTDKRAEINQARDNAEQGGFEYMGKMFDSDQVACQRMSMAAQAMSLLPASDENKITWTCQDNSTIDLTAQELLGLVGALAKHSNTCHQKASKLKAQIEAAKTAEELEKITWED